MAFDTTPEHGATSVPVLWRDLTTYPVGRKRVGARNAMLGSSELEDLEAFIGPTSNWRHLKCGECLFHAGDAFNAVYAVRSGFFKTIHVDGTGREQVMGFSMRGEFFGFDGIGTGRYDGTAIALEDSDVLILEFSAMEGMARRSASMQRWLHRIFAREIVRDYGVMMLLGSMNAERRLVSFLLDLSTRSRKQGFSATDFVLRMTRFEIGSYLGLKLETVSRVFSGFQKIGLLEVNGKNVRILDPVGLQRLQA